MEESDIKSLAKNISLLICDVDGVLTKGEVYLDNSTLELKAFNIKDGLGFKLLQQSNIEIAIITGRNSTIVDRRMTELGITHVYQGQKNKIAAYEELLNELELQPNQVAYMGDDLPDLPLMKRSGLGIAVADAHFFVREKADWITFNDGGYGAARDVADLILDAKGLLENIHDGYWQQ
ncbi:MAG: 3-deoxy-D-manno-octulosonate 8-phosphate phosphatase (KDO 8-P phosphatase) [Enterobacterales bacterium]|jgi:3-deoxy-D-manno-octulosonate 8-phosphate phosphatase (KDO 8-P phosphatase)